MKITNYGWSTSPAISRGRWAGWCRVARDPPDQGGCGCLTVASTDQEGHPADAGYQPTRRFEVVADGVGICRHVGAALLMSWQTGWA
jgi:hypothetical protein